MAGGYMAGALQSVPKLLVRRRLRIDAVVTLFGLGTWIASYLFIRIGFDTTGEGGIHWGGGFLLLISVMILPGNLVVGLISTLWQLFGRLHQPNRADPVAFEFNRLGVIAVSTQVLLIGRAVSN